MSGTIKKATDRVGQPPEDPQDEMYYEEAPPGGWQSRQFAQDNLGYEYM